MPEAVAIEVYETQTIGYFASPQILYICIEDIFIVSDERGCDKAIIVIAKLHALGNVPRKKWPKISEKSRLVEGLCLNLVAKVGMSF